jgi:hypothetical protein
MAQWKHQKTFTSTTEVWRMSVLRRWFELPTTFLVSVLFVNVCKVENPQTYHCITSWFEPVIINVKQVYSTILAHVTPPDKTEIVAEKQKKKHGWYGRCTHLYVTSVLHNPSTCTSARQNRHCCRETNRNTDPCSHWCGHYTCLSVTSVIHNHCTCTCVRQNGKSQRETKRNTV